MEFEQWNYLCNIFEHILESIDRLVDIISTKGVIMDKQEGSGVVPQTGSQASITQRLDALEKQSQGQRITMSGIMSDVSELKKRIGPEPAQPEQEAG